jgi:putative transposase
MANTYSQLYAHVVFAVKGRNNCIGQHWKTELFSYITGIVKNKGQKLMVINGVSDHVHILIGFMPDCALSSLVRDIKANSSKWIKLSGFIKGKFEWQKGYGVFTVGQSRVEKVVNYIINQEHHHLKKTFRDEYIAFLEAYNIEYNMQYIFDENDTAPTELSPEI